MMQLPSCEVCGETITSDYRYRLSGGRYACPCCMGDVLVKIDSDFPQPITDVLSDTVNDWWESNDPVYAGEIDQMEEFWNELKRDAYK